MYQAVFGWIVNYCLPALAEIKFSCMMLFAKKHVTMTNMIENFPKFITQINATKCSLLDVLTSFSCFFNPDKYPWDLVVGNLESFGIE